MGGRRAIRLGGNEGRRKRRERRIGDGVEIKGGRGNGVLPTGKKDGKDGLKTGKGREDGEEREKECSG